MEKPATVTWSLYISARGQAEWYLWGELRPGAWTGWFHRATLLATVLLCQAGYAALASLLLTWATVAPPFQLTTLPHAGLLRTRLHFVRGDTLILLEVDFGVRDRSPAKR